MNIVVPVILIPDLVEELAIDVDEARLDMEWMSLILNEFDEHAIEQAILLKEQYGGRVTVVAPDLEGADDVLFTALAKGADRLIKLEGEFEEVAGKHELAKIFAQSIQQLEPDLVLTGVQAHDDLDGSLGPLLAAFLDMPYVGYISGIQAANGVLNARKEYPGGLIAEMTVKLPAVLGIQASAEPPRYVAFSKVRQAMKSGAIDMFDTEPSAPGPVVNVDRLFEPESGEHAEMIEGDEEEVAVKLIEIFKEYGIV